MEIRPNFLKIYPWLSGVAFFFIIFNYSTLLFAQPNYEVVRSSIRDSLRYMYYDISCTDENNCTTVGYSYDENMFPGGYKILMERTYDGGKTWVTQQCDIPNESFEDDPKLKRIFAIDSTNIIIAGDSGLVYRTTDAGNTWARQLLNTKYFIKDISFVDPLHGFIIDAHSLQYLTSDGGKSWHIDSSFQSRSIASCKYFSEEERSLFREGHGPVFHTSSNGQLWDSSIKLKDTSSVPNTFILAAKANFQTPSSVFLYGIHITANSPPNGGNCFIAKSNNNGQWETRFDQSNSISDGLLAMSFNKHGKAIACGNGLGIVYSTNNGNDWNSDTVIISSQNIAYFTNLSFAGDNDVFMVGAYFLNGYIVKFHFSDLLNVDEYEVLKWGSHIYPNPSNNWFTLYTNPFFEATYSLFDIFGRKVKDFVPSGKSTVVNIEDLLSGAYRLIANYEGKQIPVGKVIVSK
jgi:photosystem II stability/assembly factor-like uncharacterized protein